MPRLSVRPATLQDRSVLQNMAAQLIEGPYRQRRAQFNWSAETLAEEFEKAQTWVGLDEQQNPVAFLCYRANLDAFEITVLATAVSAQRQGYQTQLLKNLLEKASAENKAIWLEVHSQNEEALRFYLKNGLAEVGRRVRYYSDGGSAVLMSSDVRVVS